MKYDFAVLFIMVASGALVRKIGWREWYIVVILVFGWMMFSWLKDN